MKFQFDVQSSLWTEQLGLTMAIVPTVDCVYVGKVLPGGLVATKNKQLQEYSDVRHLQLQYGDVVQCVNGQRNFESTREELDWRQGAIHMAVMRRHMSSQCSKATYKSL